MKLSSSFVFVCDLSPSLCTWAQLGLAQLQLFGRKRATFGSPKAPQVASGTHLASLGACCSARQLQCALWTVCSVHCAVCTRTAAETVCGRLCVMGAVCLHCARALRRTKTNQNKTKQSQRRRKTKWRKTSRRSQKSDMLHLHLYLYPQTARLTPTQKGGRSLATASPSLQPTMQPKPRPQLRLPT